jgi:acetyl-CoA carboxylase carboxyltransferase component
VHTKLATIIPDNPNKPYDAEVIGGIIDEILLKFIKIMPNILVVLPIGRKKH